MFGYYNKEITQKKSYGYYHIQFLKDCIERWYHRAAAVLQFVLLNINYESKFSITIRFHLLALFVLSCKLLNVSYSVFHIKYKNIYFYWQKQTSVNISYLRTDLWGTKLLIVQFCYSYKLLTSHQHMDVDALQCLNTEWCLRYCFCRAFLRLKYLKTEEPLVFLPYKHLKRDWKNTLVVHV